MTSSIAFSQDQENETPKPGFKASMIYSMLKTGNLNAKIFDRLVRKPDRGSDAISPDKFKRKLTVDERRVDGFRVITVRGPEATKNHIILLHGGAYVAEAIKGHRKLMEKLAMEHHFTVSLIDYPLAPEYNADECLAVVEHAFIMLTDSCRNDLFYLVGDSAGGGLALALLQILRDKHPTLLPKRNVLLSPWLDISMSNPEIENYIEKDVLMDVEGLKECGRIYADNKDVKDPMVSPIYGSLEQLGQMKVFISTHELFYPDCKKLKELAANTEGTDVMLTEKYKMVHDWVILPIKERDETIREVAGFLLHF